MKKIFIAVMVVTLLGLTGLTGAQDKGKDAEIGRCPYAGAGPACSMGPGSWGALKLTIEQIEKMKVLQENNIKEVLPLRNDLTAKRLEMQALWMQTNLDEERIFAKQKEVIILRDQLAEKTIKYRLAMRKILTPEQQAQWANLRDRFGGKHKNGRKHDFAPGCRHHPFFRQQHHDYPGCMRGDDDPQS